MSPAGGRGSLIPWHDRWGGFVALFVFAWIPVIGYLAPLGFAPLVALGGLMAAPTLLRARRLEAWPLAVLALALGWMAISQAWSPFHAKTVGTSIVFKLVMQLGFGVCLIGAAAALSREAARRAAILLAGAVLLLALLLLADALAGAGLYQALKRLIGQPIRPDLARRNIAQAAYVLALMTWPAFAALSRLGWRLALPPVLLILGAILATERLLSADAPLFAVGAGWLAWLAVRWIGPAAGRLLLAIGVAVFTLAPLLMLEGVRRGLVEVLHEHVGPSWDARLNIWTFVTQQAAVHPLRGWGVDASRTFGPAIPLHPHNAALQIWLELGAPGAALAGALIGWIAASITIMAQTKPSQAAAAAGALTAYLVIGCLSFGVWQEWWVALGCLTVAALAVTRRAWPNA